jgi:4-hydroxy-3-methylbut-2-enyl diphosphate reductase
LLVEQLRAAGVRVHTGVIATSDRTVDGVRRIELAASGALAVDMESAPLARALTAGPTPPAVTVVRVVADTADAPLGSMSTIRTGVSALRTLRRIGPVLAGWGRLAGPRSVVLAAPRSFCAGVERAIDIVERALERYPAPIYVRRQIVHNEHVVQDLERRGVVFVRELDEVPDGATVIFSAHGVGLDVRTEAEGRGMTVVDATCPLVAKVHAEARRYLARGDTVLLVGHAGHDEVEGTLGEDPAIRLVEDLDQARDLGLAPDTAAAVLTQTTLAVDEASAIVDELRAHLPLLETPASDDICYATTNRQNAVRAIAADSDVVLVVGSQTSSNSLRLVEVAQRCGVPAALIEDARSIPVELLAGTARVGLTAGASAPPDLVAEVIDALSGLGPLAISERTVAVENLTFTVPKEVGGSHAHTRPPVDADRRLPRGAEAAGA